MKFEKIHISGFGALQELELDDLSPGLNIIEGANEAGKTTMLEFVRTLFFGFAKHDKSNDDAKRYVPKGGVHGGWAILKNSHNESLRIERTADKTSAGACKVELLGTDRDINIEAVLSGTDRTLYEQIFAFSLDELTDFSSSDQRVQNRIYAASSGKQGEFLLDALDRTDDAANKIFLKGGRKPLLNQALLEYRELQSQVKELSGQVEDYNSDREQFLEHQQYAEEIRKHFTAIEKQLDTAKVYAAVWATWVQLSALRSELNELPKQSEFDVNQAALMADLKNKLGQQQSAIEEKQPQLERVETDLEHCVVDAVVLQNSIAIKALKEKLGTYESTVRALPLACQKLEDVQQHIKVLIEQLGPRWDEATTEKVDTSREPRLQIRRWEQTLDGQEKSIDEAIQHESATAQQVKQQEQSLKRLEDDIQNQYPATPSDEEELQQRERSLRETNVLLRKIETNNLHAEYLRKELAERQRQQEQDEKEEQQSSSAPIPSWSVFVPVTLAVLAGLVLYPQPLFAVWIVVSYVVIAIALYVVLGGQLKKLTRRKEVEKERHQQTAETIIDLQQKLHDCDRETEETNLHLRRISEEFGWNIKTESEQQQLYEELSRERASRSRYENLQADAKRRSDDLEDIEETQKAQNETRDCLKSTYKEQWDKWKSWLEEMHLPIDTSPRQTLEFCDSIEDVQDQVRRRNQHQLEIASKQKECDDFEKSAAKLWQQLQRHQPEQSYLPAAVRALSDELEKQQSLDIEQKNLLNNRQQLQEEIERQNNRLQETTKQMELILSDADCADQNEFDGKVNIFNQRHELQKKCQEQERVLETHSAPGAARQKLEDQLKEMDAERVKEKLETAQVEYSQAELDKSKAERARGEWNNKIQQRESDEGKLTSLLRQLEMQKSVIADAAKEWAVARLTNVLLDCTRERFEQERQPAVIKRAGELMSGVTAGRYQTVLASRGLDAVELDEGDNGHKPLSRWSRGTKEQFYLALRLAFIEDYCSQEHLEPLPVVMDDVLVHADGYHRLAAASAMIAGFAEKYQVLYFTCRPGDADVLSQAAPTARRFQLERGKFIATK